MALRTVMLRHKITGKKAELEQLRARAEELKTREAELENDIDAATTQEEQGAVEAAIAQHEADTAQNAADTETLEAEISGLEAELADAEEKEKAPAAKPTTGTAGNNERGNNAMSVTIRAHMSNVERRASIRESLKIAEVREFYTSIANIARREAGSLSNTSVTIPEVVVDRIDALIGDYGTIAPEVETINIGGTARVVLDGADPEAIWVEMDGAISEINASFSKVEMDGYKLAGYISVPNDVIDDSFINLADYVERKIARAIAKSKDKAILKGTGATGKQFVGIIPSLATANQVTETGFDLGAILSDIALVDDGEEAYGEIIMAMKRSTFYGRFVRGMVAVDSNGRYVAPNVANPNVAGLRVKFSQHMDKDKVLVGDFKRYLNTKRAGIKLEKSEDVKFIEDQTVFKGLIREDGKPLHVDANGKTKDWVLITIQDE